MCNAVITALEIFLDISACSTFDNSSDNDPLLAISLIFYYVKRDGPFGMSEMCERNESCCRDN